MSDSETYNPDIEPVNVLHVCLGNRSLAVKCLEALEHCAKAYDIGNNQVPAIVFLPTRCVFKAIDLWDKADAEEVM